LNLLWLESVNWWRKEQTEFFRSILALSCIEWTGAGDIGGRKEKNAHKATLGLVSKH